MIFIDIVQFYEGKLEPRWGLFKDAFADKTLMPTGNIPIAIKFADLLTPNPPVPPKKVTPEAFPRLPQPTEDLEQVKRDIKEFGYGFVKNALTPEQVAIMKNSVQEQAAGERKIGVASRGGGPQGPTVSTNFTSLPLFYANAFCRQSESGCFPTRAKSSSTFSTIP